MTPVCVTERSTQNNLQMLSYPLHPAGGIRGCTTKEGKSGQGQRELPEGQRGETFFTSIFLCGLVPSPGSLPPNTCQSVHMDGAYILFYFMLLFIFGGGGASCGAVVYGFTSGGFYCSE